MRVTLGSIMEDLLNLGQKLGDCDQKRLQDAGVTNLRFAFDRGSDAGGLTRHCPLDIGSGLLRLFWTENSAVLISGARGNVRGAKLEALKALHVLTNETSMARLLWADEHGARAALSNIPASSR